MTLGAKELLLFLSFAVVQSLARDTDYCYAYDNQPYLKFATKTAYSFVHGGKNRYQTIPNCEPVQIWMLIRNGATYPDARQVQQFRKLSQLRDQIISNHEERRTGHLCDADLENLKLWRLDSGVSEDNAAQLTEQGFEDLNLLARRTKSNFPELFPPVINDINSKNYKFRAENDNHWESSSVTAFMTGLFDGTQRPAVENPINNTLFASYNSCPRWETEVANNPETRAEAIKFAEGPEQQNLVLNVSRRLGFLSNMTIASIDAMYDMCRYDKAFKVSPVSPWCAVFSAEELKVLEYQQDLQDYYTRGYGHEYNLRLGCPPMHDLFQHFQKLERSDYSNEPKGIFNVGHSRSLHLFLAAMGFAKDSTPLLASNYRSMNKRQWRTSEIGPFAANLAAVFYKCNDNRSPNKVMFYLAEKPVSYEGCSVGLCDWQYLKNKFQSTAARCNSDFCYPNGAISLFGTPTVLLWLAVPVLAFCSN